MSKAGVVKKFFEDKGFGFIQAEGGDDVFIHVKDLLNCEALSEGDQVVFDTRYDERKGKWKAENCKQTVSARPAGAPAPGAGGAGLGGAGIGGQFGSLSALKGLSGLSGLNSLNPGLNSGLSGLNSLNPGLSGLNSFNGKGNGLKGAGAGLAGGLFGGARASPYGAAGGATSVQTPQQLAALYTAMAKSGGGGLSSLAGAAEQPVDPADQLSQQVQALAARQLQGQALAGAGLSLGGAVADRQEQLQQQQQALAAAAMPRFHAGRQDMSSISSAVANAGAVAAAAAAASAAAAAASPPAQEQPPAVYPGPQAAIKLPGAAGYQDAMEVQALWAYMGTLKNKQPKED